MAPGTRLGPYEILAPIGEGGMGDVYKARDTRLDRIVALKTSKTEFSERFEREARAVAALNHSNICTLHDVGPNYLVMEYIEGAPLKGPLPLEQALKYGAQICDALDAAHKKGITHRDLKPANIMVTKTGLKLLDFGLAKMAQAVGPQDATVRMALTGKNEILGTLYYMSPEQLQAQANGQEIDARSDIFSFGIVLYEMLTGKRAFDGPSAASVIAGIMERPAPSIAKIAPPALDRLLQRCLAKDPDDRWQSARDLKAELEWIAIASPQAVVLEGVTRNRLLPWIIAAGLAVALFGVSWIAYLATRPAELKPLVRLDLDLPVDVASTYGGVGPAAILSPDGTRLVYVSNGKLSYRRLDQPKPTELAGTEGAYLPFFSPDGHWVGFFAGDKLKKVSLEGGVPVALCDIQVARGGSWGEDGNIIAALHANGSLSKIPAVGGTPTPLLELAAGEFTQRWPQVLPGGQAVLLTSNIVGIGFNTAKIEVLSLKDHHRKVLLEGGSFGRYLPSGHLTYVINGTLFSVPFDLDSLEVRGAPAPVLEGIAYSTITGGPQLSSTETGMFLYRKGGVTGQTKTTVLWLDSDGNAQPLLTKPDSYSNPQLSPDGQRLAVEISNGLTRDIWIYEWKRDTMARLTFDVGNAIAPLSLAWSPDGRYIVFAGNDGIYWIRSDGAGKPQRLTQVTTSSRVQLPASFTPDGKRLAFYDRLRFASALETTSKDILFTLALESDERGLLGGKPELFLDGARNPMFSPDGHWLAYVSTESGSNQVFVRAFPDKGGKWQISNDGGLNPVWSPNGRELFFRSNKSRIMVASYTVKGASITVNKPKLWSDRMLAAFNYSSYGLFSMVPDGKRIAALLPVEDAEAKPGQENKMVLLLNFFDELRRKAH